MTPSSMFGPDDAWSAAFCLLKASALALPMNRFFGATEDVVVGTLFPSSAVVIFEKLGALLKRVEILPLFVTGQD